jgi:hypothetical protein
VLYTTWFVCAKELLAESERAVSEPQCHMGADSDKAEARTVLGATTFNSLAAH